ncbi:MAG: single-stranded-DNA-specific exonuclease RecJ, partial [Xanthomonadales bacterium]|nr:single-stranded-DNA-specific exonuclease RecJ [Xanthomonadales bacterium]
MNAIPEIRQRPLNTEDDALPSDLHPVLRRVLLSRGICSAGELDLSLRQLATPDTLRGTERAAEMIADAMSAGDQICVVGDFDADGATGTALAMRALRDMGAENVRFRVPNRFEFGYGLTEGLVDSFGADLPDLLITVDSGIACLKGVARAKALGARVIITDHHLPGECLPEADAIVNPNVPGDAFPSKCLAGVGVMFYLLSVLRRVLTERGWFTGRRRAPRLDQYLDLVALGTVADLVPLDHNNRVLVRQGLDRIRAGRASPGLMALLRAGKRDYRHLVASDLGFAVGPRLNAAGRMEDMGIGIRCLLTEDRVEATDLAQQLDQLNTERRTRQSEMQQEAVGMLEEALSEYAGEDPPFSLCLHDPGWHQGIVGLVASRVKDMVYRPVVAFAPEEAGSARLKGSARSIRGLHIRDVLAHVDARHPGLVPAFGGHAMAAGLSLEAARLDEFREALESSVRLFLDDQPPEACVRTDGEIEPDEIGLDLARQLRALGPWGQRFPEPLFEGSFTVLENKVVGGAHLK